MVPSLLGLCALHRAEQLLPTPAVGLLCGLWHSVHFDGRKEKGSSCKNTVRNSLKTTAWWLEAPSLCSSYLGTGFHSIQAEGITVMKNVCGSPELDCTSPAQSWRAGRTLDGQQLSSCSPTGTEGPSIDKTPLVLHPTLPPPSARPWLFRLS